MKKVLALALVMTGFAVNAEAADWVPPKVPDPIPDNLTWYGITPIGALDLSAPPAFLSPPDLPAPSLAWGTW